MGTKNICNFFGNILYVFFILNTIYFYYTNVKKTCSFIYLILFINILENCQGTIVFVEQKRTADYIAAYLSELDFPTTSIHGAREQPERELALRDFKTNKMKVLIATAVAARGLGTL